MLELGCGLEQWMRGVVAKSAPDGIIFACDLSKDVLRVFSEEFSDTWPGGMPRHFCILGDAENLPFVNRCFDGISAVFVGHHMRDAENFVKGLARTLKPNGWLLTNSVDWSNPPPDFPSQGLQRLLGKPARFVVRNAFEESRAREALNRHFAEVREHKVIIPAMLDAVEQLLTLHSRQEHFIKQVLPPAYQWPDYLSNVEQIIEEYIRLNGSYYMELPITYFIAERPHLSDV
jgi:ubiquinone/menaquinone biosynthesis C-methylase UbiE